MKKTILFPVISIICLLIFIPIMYKNIFFKPKTKIKTIKNIPVVYYQPPKNPLPRNCVLAHSYEYIETYIKDYFVLQSQIKLDHRHFKIKDLLQIRDFTLKAWAEKLTITPEEKKTFIKQTSKAHVIYTRTIDSFKEITNNHFSEDTIACISSEKGNCFKSPTRNKYVVILAPVSYHISREGTTIPKNLSPAEVFVIHEFVHWLSSVVYGHIDEHHENKFLWIDHDPKNSVQALAYQMYVDFIGNDEAVFLQTIPLLYP